MKVLITGGAGFVGSHLAERCLQQGWKVAIIDDLSTGAMDNITHLKSASRFSYTIDTVLNGAVLRELVDCADLVFHLAAAVGVRLVVDSPVRTIETNVQGSQAVLDAAEKKRKPVIITSTSEVYGKSAAVPFREDGDIVIGPTTIGRWSYACSKALDEFLGVAYWREKGVPVTIVRLFNTVGPRQTGRYGMVLPTFARQALLGKPITVHGTGRQSRCFASVTDVVEALVKLVYADGIHGEVINIGNDQEITILELAELTKKLAYSNSEIRLVPYSEAFGPGFEDMPRRVPCIDKLERLTGFRPRTSIEAIVTMVLEDMHARLMESEPIGLANGKFAGALA
jgi:UDP-glucose 4-epimerase